MELKARLLEFEAKKPIVVLNKEDADHLGVKPQDRVEIRADGKTDFGIVNVAERIISDGYIGLFEGVQKTLKAVPGQVMHVLPAPRPESVGYIKKRLAGNPLSKAELKCVVGDVIDDRLSDIEVTAFVISLYNHGMTMKEVVAVSSSMAEAGNSLKIKGKTIFDKHSIGGVPGDKTSMMLVPTIAAAGLTIPKTSSRAITSPAGTADRVECLCPVSLGIDEITEVVRKTNGCLVWGGAVDLSPADDAFIRIEYPLSIDPLLLPSVMSKKKSVNADYVVIDIPTGRGVKIKSIAEAEELASKFISLGKSLGIKVNCVSTFADQPLGYGIGPALEARELLETIERGRGPKDLINKVVELSSVLFDFRGIKNSKAKALRLIKSGKSWKKLRQIIEAQGGDPKIRPGDIPIGDQSLRVRSKQSGDLLWMNNKSIAQLAREAGAPHDKGAGLLLHKKLGDRVKKGDVLFEIFADKNFKLERAAKLTNTLDIVRVGKEYEVVLAEVPESGKEKSYLLID
jgi:AMP phosphorylase